MQSTNRLTNICPSGIDQDLWDGMSADVRYQAQKEARTQSQRIGWLRWALLAPPLLFVALPPVQDFVHQQAPPAHYVKIEGVVDSRKYLDKSIPVAGDTVKSFPVTSSFGPRVHPVHGVLTQHNGVDLGTPIGTPLYAPAVGKDKVTVRCWEDSAGGGTVAEISSASIPEYRFKALHLSECSDGDFTAGKVFAKSGNTGVGTGAHLDLRQLPANGDSHVAPMRGYVEWIISGSAGEDVIDIPALKASIIDKESAGDYTAINPHSGALGLGQIMPENLAGALKGWDYDALGRDVSDNEFLADPELQSEIIRHQLSKIALSQSTDADGNRRSDTEIAKRSAAVWYSGRGDYCSSTSREFYGAGEYPSGAEYCESIGEKYEQAKAEQAKATPSAPIATEDEMIESRQEKIKNRQQERLDQLNDR